MWLYQHTARCPIALQLFLDANPDYWCLIPITLEETKSKINTRIHSSSQIRSVPPSRLELDAKYLVDQVPDPPEGYLFTDRQKYDQLQFFRTMKDQLLSSSVNTMVDLYNAAIIAVCKYLSFLKIVYFDHDSYILFLVPENCSEILRQLLLSLFITHADCDLNKTGRLINENIYREYPLRGYWCANLVRRPLSSF